MQPRRHAIAPEEQHAEKARLEEERRETLVGHQRSEDIGRRVRIPAPVRPELERHHDAGNHAHAERHGKYLQPELRQPQEYRPRGREMQDFEYRDVGSEPDGECGQQNMQGDNPDELQPRQQERVEHPHPSLRTISPVSLYQQGIARPTRGGAGI